MHPNRCLLFRGEVAWSYRSTPTCTNALSKAHERVSRTLACSTTILTYTIHSFYPGLSQPRFAAIGSGAAQSSAAVEAPEGEEFTAGATFGSTPDESNGRIHEKSGRKVSHRANGARAARVVGSLEHPILPTPPVCAVSIMSLPSWLTNCFHSVRP